MPCSKLRMTLAFASLAVVSLMSARATLASTEIPVDPRWQVVPEHQLEQYRGGVDLGPLVASFAIQRTIQVDGVVVAQMQIVISNLDNLGNGGAPTVSISGPASELVQIMDKSGVAAAASAAQTLMGAGTPAGVKSDTSPALTSSATGSGLTVNGQNMPGTISSSGAGNSGSVVGGGQSTGSSAQFGNALNSAINVATGASSSSPTSGGSPGTSNGSPSASTASPAGSISSPMLAATSSGSGGASGGGVVPAGTPIVVVPATIVSTGSTNSSLVTSKTVALGNTGQVAVLSNLPSASALTTAVQNDVRGATIQAQTTISATLNSLSSLNAVSLANQIHQQVALSIGGG